MGLRQRYNGGGRYAGNYRERYNEASQGLSFTATDTGYINITSAHDGTCEVYVDGVLTTTIDPLEEKVVNGTFDAGLTSWALNANATGVATVVDGELVYSTPHGDYAETKQTSVSVIDELYLVSFEVTSAGVGANLIFTQFGRSEFLSEGATSYTVGSYSKYLTSTHTDGFSISARTDTTIGIDNVSAKLIGQLSLLVTEGQVITFVYSNPETVTYLDMDKAPLTGDASQFAQFVNLTYLTYPDMDPKGFVGADQLTNGDCSTLTGWTQSPGTQFAATSGTFVGTGNSANNFLGQDFGLAGAVGGVYEIEYRVTQNSLAVKSDLELSADSAFPTQDLAGTVGIHRYTLFATNASPTLDFYINIDASTTGGTITIDYFSVKPLTNQVVNGGFDADTDWAKGTGWTIGSGVASSDGTQTGNSTLQQENVVSVNSVYKWEYDFTVTAGNITWNALGGYFDGTNINTSGSFFAYVPATTTDNLSIAGDLNYQGTIDNVLILPWPDQSIGSIASLPNTLTDLEITDASSLDWTAGALDAQVLLTTITLDAMNWTVEEVNAFFASLVVCEAAGDSGRDCVVTITNMFRPTGQGLTDAATTLPGKGWTINIPAA